MLHIPVAEICFVWIEKESKFLQFDLEFNHFPSYKSNSFIKSESQSQIKWSALQTQKQQERSRYLYVGAPSCDLCLIGRKLRCIGLNTEMTIRQKDSSFHLLIMKASLVGVKEMSAVGRNPAWKLVKKTIKKPACGKKCDLWNKHSRTEVNWPLFSLLELKSYTLKRNDFFSKGSLF